MNLNRIRYFVAVAEDLHFGHAAARLNVVQPAISQQIKLLERELGIELLNRSPRKISLTDAGKAYLTEARRALLQVALAARAARDALDGLSGQLAIGFVDNAIWSPLPLVIRSFREAYPGVDLKLVQVPRGKQLVMLQDGDLDVAVVPGPLFGRDIIVQDLTRAPLYVVLPEGHPLCAELEVPISALAEEPFVALPAVDDPKRINEIVNALCADAGFAPILGQAVEQMHTALSLVSAGLGVSIVPSWMCQAWTENVEYRRLLPHADYLLLLAVSASRNREVVKRFLAMADVHSKSTADGQCSPDAAPPE